MESGVRADQVGQVRGFADQQLRKPDDPENPSNRRISVLVQYQPQAHPAAGEGEAKKPEGHSPEKPAEKPAEKSHH